MNIHRIKGLCWLGSLALGGYLAWFVADFLKKKPELEQGVTRAEQLAVLEGVQDQPPPKANLVSYDLVKKGFLNVNWTGYEEPPKVDPVKTSETTAPPKKPVADLLRVKLVQVDTDSPEESFAFVDFLDPKLKASAPKQPDRVLRVGDRLKAPYTYIRVADLLPGEGVRFAFDDEEREPELVPAAEFESAHGHVIAILGEGEIAAAPAATSRIVERNEFQRRDLKKTSLIGRDTYQIGSEDAEYFAQNYSAILSQDVRYRKHRDPRTGQVDGLEITSVTPGSFAARHGLNGGEVIKSINGNPVTSVNEAIAYVKKEKDHTDTWVVVYERQGKEYTATYHSSDYD